MKSSVGSKVVFKVESSVVPRVVSRVIFRAVSRVVLRVVRRAVFFGGWSVMAILLYIHRLSCKSLSVE